MNPLHESKQELNAAIRYAENAISSAKQTMESMNTYQEQTGREQALQSQVKLLEERIADMQSDMVGDAATIKQLNEEREMLEKNVKYLRDENERLKAQVNALEQPEQPTMPVIPKAVAIAIFREGMAYGVSNACDELDNAADIEISETGYTGDFEVSFSTNIDLSEHLDLDWMRDKVGDYDEASVIEALKNLCADKEFECRIHGVDDEESDSKGS